MTISLTDRFRSRTWLRGVVTTYAYGFNQAGTVHGDLVGVGYSNDPANTPVVTYTYDRQGRRSQVVQNGITTTLTYDDANQLLTETNANGLLNGVSVNWTYNNSLQPASLGLAGVGSTYSVSYGYDLAGRLYSVNSGANGATNTYLANSPLVDHITFSQSGTTFMTTSNQWDYLNRLTRISTVNGGQQTLESHSYGYNNANQRIRRTLADTSYWVYTNDALGQVISGKRYWPNASPVAGQQFEYVFDDIGNRKTTGAGGDPNGGNLRSAAYSANRVNQYTSRTVPGYVSSLGTANAGAKVALWADGGAYAQATRQGNYFWTELAMDNTSRALWVNLTNLAALNNGSNPDKVAKSIGHQFLPYTPEQFSYDADGNLTQDGHWTYGWDGENRLASLTPSTSVGPQISVKFDYDSQGRRIRKQIWDHANWTGTITNDLRFVYDGWNLLAELNTQNSALRTYTWGLDLSGSPQGAGGVGGLLFISNLQSPIGYYAPAYDGNANVAALISMANGTVAAQYEYGPFGEVIRATGPMAKTNPFRFSTKYQDDETDLLYYGYRYYNQGTGRWICRDPSDEVGGLNLYGMLECDSVNEVDSLGLSSPLRFVVIFGNGSATTDAYSNPRGYGQGSGATDGSTYARTYIKIFSGNPKGSGTCNTIVHPIPYDQCAGAIQVFFRGCPGKYSAFFNISITLRASGRFGRASGALSGGDPLVYYYNKAVIPKNSPQTFDRGIKVDFEATNASSEKRILWWEPVIAMAPDPMPRTSSGEAEASITFVYLLPW